MKMWKDLRPEWQAAFEEAWAAFCAGCVPIGAAIYDANGKLIVRDRNRAADAGTVNRRIAHAEMHALHRLNTEQPSAPETLTLYATMEPCPMCMGTAVMSGIRHIRYAARDSYCGAVHLAETDAYIRNKGMDCVHVGGEMQFVQLTLQSYYERMQMEMGKSGKVLRCFEATDAEAVRLAEKLYEKRILEKWRSVGAGAMYDRLLACRAARMQKAAFYCPAPGDLWFRETLLGDAETMSFNHAYGGTVAFPPSDWAEWYTNWVSVGDGTRFYRYLMNDSGEFVGEACWHFDTERGVTIADIVVYAPHRGRGYGRAGLLELCKAAKQAGIRTLHDDIAIDNPSVELFLRCGFGETVLLLGRKQVGDYVKISVNTADLEENVGFKPNNDDIKAYIEEKYGFKVHSAYIGQVKGKLGIREHENYHDSHTSPRKPCVCPPEKEEAIVDALKHFGYIK